MRIVVLLTSNVVASSRTIGANRQSRPTVAGRRISSGRSRNAAKLVRLHLSRVVGSVTAEHGLGCRRQLEDGLLIAALIDVQAVVTGFVRERELERAGIAFVVLAEAFVDHDTPAVHVEEPEDSARIGSAGHLLRGDGQVQDTLDYALDRDGRAAAPDATRSTGPEKRGGPRFDPLIALEAD